MSSERTLERAMQDARSGRLDAAIASVRTLLRVQPRDADALQVLGLLLTQNGQQEQAVTQLERAVAIAPEVAGYRNNLGNALMAAARNREAAEQYESFAKNEEFAIFLRKIEALRKMLDHNTTFVLSADSLGILDWFNKDPAAAARPTPPASR